MVKVRCRFVKTLLIDKHKNQESENKGHSSMEDILHIKTFNKSLYNVYYTNYHYCQKDMCNFYWKEPDKLGWASRAC